MYTKAWSKHYKIAYCVRPVINCKVIVFALFLWRRSVHSRSSVGRSFCLCSGLNKVQEICFTSFKGPGNRSEVTCPRSQSREVGEELVIIKLQLFHEVMVFT
jgi:hypothetical protein